MDFKNETLHPAITKKYEIIEYMGKGSIGVVYKALDRYRNRIKAIKKCKDIVNDQFNFKKVILEILILFDLQNKYENIIEIEMVYILDNDLYIITDFLESDLNMLNN